MHLAPEKKAAKVSLLYDKWLTQVEVRNSSAYGSARYNQAEAKAEKIENEASLLVFNDNRHSMSECMEFIESL